MHAVLASLGTDGDLLPIIGLASTLRVRGHDVTLVAAGNYSSLAADHDLPFRELVSARDMQSLFANADVWHPLKAAQISAKWGAKLIAQQFEIFRQLAGDDSVFISNPAVFAMTVAAEKFSRPLVHVVLQPWMIPSAQSPPLMPIFTVPKWAPPLVYRAFLRLVDIIGDRYIGPDLNRLRTAQGLLPQCRILSNWFSKQLILGMFPDWYGSPQPDWPQPVRLTGFPRFDGAIQRALPGKVIDFVTRKKPTILFTFGSGMMHARGLLESAQKICADLNAQGLILNRFQDLKDFPAHMMQAVFLPFREIFPHCAAILHHGGIGTTAEALAAGVPQLIIPLGFDQLDNGARIKKLGVGLHLPSKHNLVPNHRTLSKSDYAKITTALKRMLSGEFRPACIEISRRLQSENALEMAAGHIESVAMCDSPRTH
jgi:rhamnosyltransferase subunit B